MNVVAVMEASPTDGGGFYQALNAVEQMKRFCDGQFSFAVGAVHPGTRIVLAELGIVSFALPITLADRIRFLAWRPKPRSPLSGTRMDLRVRARPRWLRKLIDFLRAVPDPVGLERRLVDRRADLVYFVAPWGRLHHLDRLPYWITIWDLAHVEHDEFPELAGAARLREKILNEALTRAGAVIADSPASKALIVQRYGVKAERVVAMPFLPAPNLHAADRTPTEDALASLGLERGYLFYPAQFWAHKNHVRILEALAICRDRGHSLHVVFAGGDMGGRRHVETIMSSLKLDDRVRFLGFVDPRTMRGLYEACSAVVMPTYFGPTNLPPLEAWTIGVPLIYSSHLAEQAGDAALLIDPDDAEALAEAMISVQDPFIRDVLVANGLRRLQALALERRAAEANLSDRLRRFQARLRCFRSTI